MPGLLLFPTQVKATYRALSDPALYEAVIMQSLYGVHERRRTPAVFAEVACRIVRGFLWKDAHWKMERTELLSRVRWLAG